MQPRFAADRSGWSSRGEFDPTFCPKKKIASQWSKSSRRVVPTGTPIRFLSATDVVSWHMLLLSGRLLLPYSRANSAYIYDVSRLARPLA